MIRKTWTKSLSVSVAEEKYTHSLSRVAVILSAIFTFLLALLASILFHSGSTLFGLRIFSSSLVDVNRENPTELSSSNSFFFIWILVFVWQIVWLTYGTINIFRKSSSDYFYKYPPVMHWFIFFNFAASNILYIACLVFWSRSMFTIAACYSILVMIGLEIATFMSFFKLSDYLREMFYTEKIRDVWAIRMLVQNGLILYAAWSFVVFLINLDQCLVHEVNLSKKLSHLIVLGVLLIKLVIYFIVETLLAYKYCKFLVTPWIVYAVYLYDTIMNQTILQNDQRKIMNASSSIISTTTTLATPKLSNNEYLPGFLQTNISFFLHACLLGVLLFLLLAKIFKFVWYELCNQKFNSL